MKNVEGNGKKFRPPPVKSKTPYFLSMLHARFVLPYFRPYEQTKK